MTAIDKKEYQKQYRLDNKEKLKELKKKWVLNNKEKIYKYNLENKEKKNEKNKIWRLNNKQKAYEKQKLWAKNNTDKRKLSFETYRLKNKEKLNEKNKKYYLNNKEKICKKVKLYYENNKEKIKEYNIKYCENNKEKIKEYKRKYMPDYTKNRKLINPLFKLSCNLRTSILNHFKKNGYTKRSKTYQILGCTYEEFKIYIENKFTEGMNWDNQGKWHLDHIYPVSRATNEEHLIKLNHYTNFQPLWAIDNLKKGNKIL